MTTMVEATAYTMWRVDCPECSDVLEFEHEPGREECPGCGVMIQVTGTM